MRLIKPVGLTLAMLAALVCLYQLSLNGRYVPHDIHLAGKVLIIDTRTGDNRIETYQR